MGKILLLDEDLDGFIEYVKEGLADKGLDVRGFKYLGDAYLLVDSDEPFDAAVIDVMLPIRTADDDAFRALSGREPREEDAMRAGLFLIPLLNEKKIPVFAITHLNKSSSLGRRVLGELQQLKKDGRIRGYWEKPPYDSFYKAVKAATEET